MKESTNVLNEKQLKIWVSNAKKIIVSLESLIIESINFKSKTDLTKTSKNRFENFVSKTNFENSNYSISPLMIYDEFNEIDFCFDPLGEKMNLDIIEKGVLLFHEPEYYESNEDINTEIPIYSLKISIYDDEDWINTKYTKTKIKEILSKKIIESMNELNSNHQVNVRDYDESSLEM